MSGRIVGVLSVGQGRCPLEELLAARDGRYIPQTVSRARRGISVFAVVQEASTFLTSAHGQAESHPHKDGVLGRIGRGATRKVGRISSRSLDSAASPFWPSPARHCPGW